MKSILPPQSSRRGSRLVSLARALPAVLALAALAVPTRSLAQTPTFNALVQTPVTVGSGFPEDATVGDINGDGKLDVMIPGINGIRMMLGNGDGTFVDMVYTIPDVSISNVVNLHSSLVAAVTAQSKPVGNIGGLGGGIKAVDVNRDGKLDLVCVTTVGINFTNWSFVSVLINTGVNDANGVPIFTTTHHWIPFLGVRPITIGDLNGDGWPDFIVGTGGGTLQVWTSNGGTGTFTPGQVAGLTPGGGGPAVGQGVIADLNGDGRADYVVTSNQNGGANIFFGNGDGTLQTPATYLPNGAVSVAVADLNGDGRPDLVMGNTGAGTEGVSVYLNNGGGAFGAPTLYAIPSFSSSFAGGASVAVADINGDGKLDAVLTNTNSNSIAVLLGDATGGFGTPFTYAAATFPTNGVVGDFNGDGKPDIGFVLRNSRSYGVLTNTTVVAPPLPTQTLTILGGSGSAGAVAANVEYYNPATGNWQPAYLAQFYNQYGWPVSGHPWGNVPGTNQWINYRADGRSSAGAGPTTNQTLWYLYRVRFTVPADAIDPKMTFSLKADNFAQVAINGVTAGGSTQYINYTNVNNVVVGTADQVNVDATFSQNVHPGENTITLNIGDWGGLNGFNFRIDLSMKSSQPIVVVTPPSDTTPPVIVAPGDITKEATSAAGAVVTFTASATDNVDGPVNVVASPASGSTFAIKTTVVGLAASDAAHNTATASFNVTVRDTTAPALTVPASITAEATGPGGATVSYPDATASDAVGVTSLTYSKASGSTFALGTTTVDVTASDAATNATTKSFNVSVVDTTAPAITSVPADITAEATSASGATVTYGAATATDAVGVSALTYSQSSGTTFALGTTTVTVTAKDAAGNSSTKTFTVTVRDTTAPAIASVTPSSATLWPPNHQMVAITVNAVASDSVGVASLKIIGVTSSEPDNGLGDGDTPNDIQITGNLTVNLRAERAGGGNGRTYTITVEARDAAGNATTKTCTVSVPKSQGGK